MFCGYLIFNHIKVQILVCSTTNCTANVTCILQIFAYVPNQIQEKHVLWHNINYGFELIPNIGVTKVVIYFCYSQLNRSTAYIMTQICMTKYTNNRKKTSVMLSHIFYFVISHSKILYCPKWWYLSCQIEWIFWWFTIHK